MSTSVDQASQTTVNSQITDLIWSIPSSETVSSNYQLDKHLKLSTNPDSMVFVECSKCVDSESLTVGKLKLPVKVAPVAAYRKFTSSCTVVGTQSYELTKKTGYSSTFSSSVSVKASISGSIGVCESSVEVSTEFSYSNTDYGETDQTWTTTLTDGNYTVYQNVLLYAFKCDAANDPAVLSSILKDSPNMEFHTRTGTRETYFFVPVYINNPFTIKYSSDTYDPICEDDLIDYLMADGYSKWSTCFSGN